MKKACLINHKKQNMRTA